MRRLVIAAFVIAALISGCGDSDDDGTQDLPAENTPTAPKATNEVTVEETEFKLEPAQVAAGEEGLVTVKLVNKGDVAHSLAVEGPNGLVEMDGQVEPGANGTLEVDLDKPGTYSMYCPLGSHASKGMRGSITVTGSSAARGEDGVQTTSTTTGAAPTQTSTSPAQTQTQTETQTETKTVTTPSATSTSPTATTGTPAPDG